MNSETVAGIPPEDDSVSQEDMHCQLENYLAAKKIEADPKKLARLKEYALSQSKVISELFDVNKTPAPKSLKDLKKVYNDKVMEKDDD